MFSLKIENMQGNIITLTQNETAYQVIDITGLNPPNAQLNTSKVAMLDGTKFNSSTLNERNVVITLKLNSNIEQNRLNLYSYFITKQWCKIYYQNENRNVFIEGYVENVECDLFDKNELMQISILCPNPYFKSLLEIVEDLSQRLAMFAFPFAINNLGVEFSTVENSIIKNVYNDSESETGVIIDIEFLKTVTKLKLIDVTYSETLTVNYNFSVGDRLTINTNKGEKSIILNRGGAITNIFSSIERGSTFFQLRIGDNVLSYSINDGLDNDAISLQFKYRTLFRGV